jgi:osmotically inducible lipoprotein OsmB
MNITQSSRSRSIRTSCAALALAVTLAGCGAARSAVSEIEEEPVGTAVGAGLGALAGALLTDNAFGALLGAAVGGYAGQQIAEEWDETDRNHVERAMQTNETVSWTDTQTDLAYTVRPGDVVTGYAPGAELCRQFTMQIGAPADTSMRGIACREGSTWRISEMRRVG